jgi:tRNA threonylcarbamoyladenosine biosynthesis protein TsaB
MLDDMAKMIDLDLNTVDAIAVAGGPGSFTGLRIGSATAKGLGLALKKPLISIPTVDGLAYNLCGTEKIVCPLMDARRNQVYTGIYEFAGNELKVLEAQMAVDIAEIAEKLNVLGREVIFLGDGWPVYAEKLAGLLTVPYMAAPAHQSRQRAGALAALAMCYAKEGRRETAAEHEPDYLRLSQAERERAEKEKAAK